MAYRSGVPMPFQQVYSAVTEGVGFWSRTRFCRGGWGMGAHTRCALDESDPRGAGAGRMAQAPPDVSAGKHAGD